MFYIIALHVFTSAIKCYLFLLYIFFILKNIGFIKMWKVSNVKCRKKYNPKTTLKLMEVLYTKAISFNI